MRIITRDAAAEPDDFLNAEVVGKKLLQVFARESWVALLHGAEQTFFCGQHQALAVHVNAATFEHNVVRLAIAHDSGSELLQLELIRDERGQLAVMIAVWILGPGIEAPIGGGDGILLCVATDKYRTGVARPSAIGGPHVKLYALEISAAAGKNIAGFLFRGGIADDDVHVFHPCEMTDDFGVDPRDGFELARPVSTVLRPGEPCG